MNYDQQVAEMAREIRDLKARVAFLEARFEPDRYTIVASDGSDLQSGDFKPIVMAGERREPH